MAMAKKSVARKVPTKKTSVKKGGVFDPRQPGYVKPGGLSKRDAKLNESAPNRTGLGYGEPKLNRRLEGKSKLKYDSNGNMILATGINPRAMKASSGNPKPTAKNMASGKKATSVYKAKQAAAAKAKATAVAKAKAKAAKTAKKPTTGVYKRNPGS